MISSSSVTVVFGGTFDPVQCAHVAIIRELMSEYELVVVAPTAQNPLKEASASPFELRVEMIRLVLAAEKIVELPEPKGRGVYVSTEPYVYVCDFVKWWKEKYGTPIAWAVGPDAYQEVEKWKNWESLKLELPLVQMGEKGDIRSTRIRKAEIAPHPAIANFIREHSLYDKMAAEEMQQKS